ncbi:MAG TPA: ATP-binding protein [Bacteroidales bacterium]|nr:ATP-binding protein [Bacteroidales bacterium]
MITTELKNKVLAELKRSRENFTGSDAKYAVSLGLNNAVYSRIKNGEIDKVLSEAMWISLARKFNVSLKNEAEWKTANTPVFQYITEQLTRCQDNSISCMLCDAADIGKTYTAKIYVKTHKNAVYVDCSQTKSKQKLIRFIAKEFGVGHTGKYNDVYEDLVFYLRSIATPIIILDEAGDLDYAAFLELKALWNASERACGWMMMGAEGLKEKVRRAIGNKKVGYTEIFSRYGNRYQRITPEGREEHDKFTRLQAALIIQANTPAGTKLQELIHKTDGSLRRIYIEISKRTA